MAVVGRVGKLWYPDSRMVVWQKIRRELGQGRSGETEPALPSEQQRRRLLRPFLPPDSVVCSLISVPVPAGRRAPV